MTGSKGSPLLVILAGILIGAGLGLAVLFGFDAGDVILSRLGVGADTPFLVPERRERAADFELDSLGGGTVRLAELRGRPVIINFWATWCGPCRLEMPVFQNYSKRHAEDLVVLGVNFDEPETEVQAFVEELGLTFPILLDPGGKVVELYQVRGFPTTLFVDADGHVRFQHIGPLDEGQLAGYLEKVGVNP